MFLVVTYLNGLIGFFTLINIYLMNILQHIQMFINLCKIAFKRFSLYDQKSTIILKTLIYVYTMHRFTSTNILKH